MHGSVKARDVGRLSAAFPLTAWATEDLRAVRRASVPPSSSPHRSTPSKPLRQQQRCGRRPSRCRPRRANIGSDRRIRVKIRMAPPRLARRISWRRHEITFRPPKFCGEAATKFRARRRFSHPYLPPYSLVARRYSTGFAAASCHRMVSRSRPPATTPPFDKGDPLSLASTTR